MRMMVHKDEIVGLMIQALPLQKFSGAIRKAAAFQSAGNAPLAYAGYTRDPEGNKIAAYCFAAE